MGLVAAVRRQGISPAGSRGNASDRRRSAVEDHLLSGPPSDKTIQWSTLKYKCEGISSFVHARCFQRPQFAQNHAERNS